MRVKWILVCLQRREQGVCSPDPLTMNKNKINPLSKSLHKYFEALPEPKWGKKKKNLTHLFVPDSRQ